MEPRHYRKTGLVAAFLAISIGIITTPAATQFEASVYTGISPSLWLGLGLLLTVAFGSLIHRLTDTSSSFLLPFTCFVVYAFILFLLPVLRGYVLYGRGGADVLFHLGHTKTIIETGELHSTNWYPATHTLLAIFQYFGVPKNQSSLVLVTLFTFLGALSTIVFLRLYDRRAAMAIAGLAFLFPYSTFHRTLHPVILSFLLIPFLYYLYYRSSLEADSRFVVLAIGLCGSLVLFHPTTIVLAIIILAVSITAASIYNWYWQDVSRPSITYPLILGVLFFAWYNTFARFEQGVLAAVGQLLFSRESDTVGRESDTGAPEFDTVGQSTTESAAAFDPIGLLIRTLELFGAQLFLATLTPLIAVIIIYKAVAGRANLLEIDLEIQLVVATVFTTVFLSVNILGSDLIRVSRYSILITVLLVALLVASLARAGLPRISSRTTKIAAIGLIVGVLAFAPIAAAGLYHDNYHYTETEHGGTGWYFEYRNPALETSSFWMTYKVAYYHEGPHNIGRGEAFGGLNDERYKLPPHLGANRSHAAAAYSSQSYVITKRFDIEYRPSTENVERPYTGDDLRAVESDPSMNRLYSNEHYTVWLTNQS